MLYCDFPHVFYPYVYLQICLLHAFLHYCDASCVAVVTSDTHPADPSLKRLYFNEHSTRLIQFSSRQETPLHNVPYTDQEEKTPLSEQRELKLAS